MKAFGWYKKMHDEVMNDPERKARYEDCMAELIDDEKMITNLKRLLFEAVPYIEADIDYNSMAECGDYERARIGRRLLEEIKEALREEKTK